MYYSAIIDGNRIAFRKYIYLYLMCRSLNVDINEIEEHGSDTII